MLGADVEGQSAETRSSITDDDLHAMFQKKMCVNGEAACVYELFGDISYLHLSSVNWRIAAITEQSAATP